MIMGEKLKTMVNRAQWDLRMTSVYCISCVCLITGLAATGGVLDRVVAAVLLAATFAATEWSHRRVVATVSRETRVIVVDALDDWARNRLGEVDEWDRALVHDRNSMHT